MSLIGIFFWTPAYVFIFNHCSSLALHLYLISLLCIYTSSFSQSVSRSFAHVSMCFHLLFMLPATCCLYLPACCSSFILLKSLSQPACVSALGSYHIAMGPSACASTTCVDRTNWSNCTCYTTWVDFTVSQDIFLENVPGFLSHWLHFGKKTLKGSLWQLEARILFLLSLSPLQSFLTQWNIIKFIELFSLWCDKWLNWFIHVQNHYNVNLQKFKKPIIYGYTVTLHTCSVLHHEGQISLWCTYTHTHTVI